MKPEDAQKYCSLMSEIKRRTAVIDGFSSGVTHALYAATTVESVYLQFRKILELIALGSLVANKETFSNVYENFSKYWNAEFLVKDIERINPDFYPRPIIQQVSSKPGTKMDLLDRSNDYLTKEELIKLYKKCGAVLHSGNPYGSQIDYAYHEGMIPHWREKIVNLLNAHLIRLINDPNLYLIQMGNMEEDASYGIFAPHPVE
jgi:hypothetical protein